MTRTEPRLEVCADAAALVERAAVRVSSALAAAIAARGRARWALAGGTTPRALYRRLAAAEAPGLDWRKVVLFWGDERLVPADSPQSNFGSARATGLVSRVPLEQVHPWTTELAPAAAAARYQRELAHEFALTAGEWPRFDLVLLGLGADGHTASLFPATPALEELHRLAVANPVAALGAVRLTLTLPVLAAARAVVFLVSGAEKAEAVARAFGGGGESVPAGRVRPTAGSLEVLLDRDAAVRLPGAPGR
jgi:6-phosphogluconolactonase